MVNDNYCQYSKASHRYVLTTDYVLEVLNVDLYDTLSTSGGVSDVAKMPEILLERVSRQIYGYIYSNSAYNYETERRLALDDKYRPHLIEAMAEQITYILNNGDVSAYTGVNPMTGASTDAARMRLAEIAPIARDILQNRGIIDRGLRRFQYVDEPTYTEDAY